jgi:hypothetical protein
MGKEKNMWENGEKIKLMEKEIISGAMEIGMKESGWSF